LSQTEVTSEIDRSALVREFQDSDPTYPSDKEFHHKLIREEIDEVATAYARVTQRTVRTSNTCWLGRIAKVIIEYPADIIENLYAFEHLYQSIPSAILNEAFVRVQQE
jgi:hypothetical protein